MENLRLLVLPMRMHGCQSAAYPFPVAQRHRRKSLLEGRQCPSCGRPLSEPELGEREPDEVVLLPLGPGRSEVMRAAQRQGKWFDSYGIGCHRRCVGDVPVLGISGKVAAAARLLDVAADELSERAKDLPDEYNPTADVRFVAEKLVGMSHDVAGYEDRIL